MPNDFHKEFTHRNNTYAQIHIPLYTFLYIRTCMIFFVFVVVKDQYATMHEAHHAKLKTTTTPFVRRIVARWQLPEMMKIQPT